MIVLKVNFLNSLKMLSDMIARSILLVLIFFVLKLSHNDTFIVILLLVFSIPTVYLHLDYYYKDKKKKIQVKNRDVLLILNEEEILLNSANKVVINGSVGLTRSIVHMFISPKYYSITFYFKNNIQYSVSSIIDIKFKDIVLERFDKEIIEYEYFLIY